MGGWNHWDALCRLASGDVPLKLEYEPTTRSRDGGWSVTLDGIVRSMHRETPADAIMEALADAALAGIRQSKG